jgi:ubiquinone/menaquinone biosynthesis C-methylase UbiE
MDEIERRTASQHRWLKFWNAIVYRSLAPLYNGLDWLTFGVWWRLVGRALEFVPPDQRVLEIGFGPGKLHAELARHSAVCVGVDLAKGMCRFTARRLRRSDLPVRIVRGSVFELPFSSGTFDIVVSTFAFSGFPNAADAMQEMARMLRPGGSMVLIDIGLPAGGNRVGVALARLWEQMGDYLYDQPALMSTAGLRVDTFEEFGPGHHIRAIVGQRPA